MAPIWEHAPPWGADAPERVPAPFWTRETGGTREGIDLFRLLVAVVGLGVYLGVPIGALVGLLSLVD